MFIVVRVLRFVMDEGTSRDVLQFYYLIRFFIKEENSNGKLVSLAL